MTGEPLDLSRWALRTTRDPDAEALVAQMLAMGAMPLSARGVVGARAYLEERAASAAPGPDLEAVANETVGVGDHSLPVRTYRPAAGGTPPVVVYFHGGGWVVGSVSASDAFCRRLAAAASCVVVSADYRLAPEHPYPAAVDDAVAAIEWSHANAARLGGDPDRLVVLGDSAGGNVATASVGRLVAGGSTLVARQVLAYPGTTGDRDTPSNDFGNEWPLTDAERVWFIDQYVTDAAMRTDPEVAPLRGDPTGMPPTTLIVGGCDPLSNEGLAYAEHLWEAGVPVDLHFYPGQIHGFLTFDPAILGRSAEALEVVATAIRHA